MKINPYEYRISSNGGPISGRANETYIDEKFKQTKFWIFCLNIGNVSRINRYVPITEVKFHDFPVYNHFVFKCVKTGKEIDFATHIGLCELHSTYESAAEAFEELKKSQIEKTQKKIDSILVLQNRIRNL